MSDRVFSTPLYKPQYSFRGRYNRLNPVFLLILGSNKHYKYYCEHCCKSNKTSNKQAADHACVGQLCEQYAPFLLVNSVSPLHGDFIISSLWLDNIERTFVFVSFK